MTSRISATGHGVKILERAIHPHGERIELLPNWLGNLAVYRIQSQ